MSNKINHGSKRIENRDPVMLFGWFLICSHDISWKFHDVNVPLCGLVRPFRFHLCDPCGALQIPCLGPRILVMRRIGWSHWSRSPRTSPGWEATPRRAWPMWRNVVTLMRMRWNLVHLCSLHLTHVTCQGRSWSFVWLQDVAETNIDTEARQNRSVL